MVVLEPLNHRGASCIAIRGRLSPGVHRLVNQVPGRKYSGTRRCYYVIFSPENLQQLIAILSQADQVVVRPFPEIGEGTRSLSVSASEIPEEYTQKLIRMRYSPRTQKNYAIQFRNFLQHISPAKAAEITTKHIDDYLIYLVSIRKVSLSTQNQAINSIKFYLEHVMGEERRVYYTERPRKELKLPMVLSESEIVALFKATKNRKHRAMMYVLYSAGLRMSELLSLRWRDLDIGRGMIFVRGGKGNKDRKTLLSPAALEYLKYYQEGYKSKYWVFEGITGKQYSARSVNSVIKYCARKAGITKNVSAHTLRHSFATHLMESGTDTRYIQALLGHESSRTTERYAHVTTRGFDKLRSPLDNLLSQVTAKDDKDI